MSLLDFQAKINITIAFGVKKTVFTKHSKSITQVYTCKGQDVQLSPLLKISKENANLEAGIVKPKEHIQSNFQVLRSLFANNVKYFFRANVYHPTQLIYFVASTDIWLSLTNIWHIKKNYIYPLKKVIQLVVQYTKGISLYVLYLY